MKVRSILIGMCCILPFFVFSQRVGYSGSIAINYSFPNINSFEEGYDGDTIFVVPAFTYLFNQKRTFSKKVGFEFFSNIHIAISERLRLRTGLELTYHQTSETINTFDLTEESQNTDTTLNYVFAPEAVTVNRNIKLLNLTIPINFEYSILKGKWFVFSGIGLSSLLNNPNDKTNILGIDPIIKNIDNLILNNFSWKANIGSEFQVYKNIYLKVNYSQGINNLFNEESATILELPNNYFRKTNWKAFLIGVTYRFF